MAEQDNAVVWKDTKQAPLGGWHKVTLGDILSFSNGSSSPNRSDSWPHPVYGSNGIIGFTDETNADANVIVIGRVGSYCGSLYFSDSPCWITDNAIRANPVDENDAKYLYYLLHTLNLNEWRTGSGQPLLNQTILSSIPTSVPRLQEQRDIAHILATLDDKIELNRSMNETLEEMARALFKSWFVDFEPVRAKMEGRWRRGESLPGMPAELYDVFPDGMVDSELGEIPEGWGVRALKDFATAVYGAPFSSKRFNDSRVGLPLIRIRDLATHNPGVFTDERHPKGHLILPADIIVGMDGEFRAHIWKGPQAWLNQRVCHFEPLPGIPNTTTAFRVVGVRKE